MRNLAGKWTPAPDWPTATLSTPGLTVRSLSGYSQYLVSGKLASWQDLVGVKGEPAGALSIARGDRYTQYIARDRILTVSRTPIGIDPGWHASGFAVSSFDAGLHMFEVEGPEMLSLFARATTLDPAGQTASAALLFAGANALCYRHSHEDRLRIHIDRALAPYLWRWLEQAILA